jgi:hypothetical protein
VSPTFEAALRARREYRRLSREQRRAFDAALAQFVAGLRERPRRFPPALRVKSVQGHTGVFELSFGDGGRATFEYGDELRPGEPHVLWRRIGDHSAFADP